ncbi:MAG TPA: RNA-binding cell elongation regulator Jag/EloR [Candidatus Avimonas sp.]|nr:RNA-binding cell elongation regulator Jag/EloR [Candidatus Avimonas sp.]
MLREVIKEADTIEEAKRKAAQALEMPEEELQFEILQLPQKKTFGLFGGCPARIRAYYEITPARQAAEFLKDILAKMGVTNPDVTVKEEDENGSSLEITGEDLGFIIGRRGETLDSLQYLAGLVANRVDNSYYRITLNIGDYREKREQSLIGLAKKTAKQVARTGKKVSLEPMNPYERRIIHTAVQEVKGATSWSVGTEPHRHVIIGPTEDNLKKKPKRGRKNTRKKSAKPESSYSVERPERVIREFVPRSNPLPTADGATPPSKTMSEKEESSALYGRLDL